MNTYIFLYVTISFFFFFDTLLISPHGLGNTKDKKIINLLSLFLLIFISGTRNVGGSDFHVYQRVYESTPIITHVQDAFQRGGYEYGFIVLVSLAKTLGLSYQGFLMVNSAFFYYSFYYGFHKYGDNFSLVLLVFLYKMFFYDTFISIRQSITIAIFFLSFHLIFEKKFFKYFAWCALSFFIHMGSFLLGFLFLLYYFQNISRKQIGLLYLIFLPTILLRNIPEYFLNSLAWLFNSSYSDVAFVDKMGDYLLSDDSLSLIHLAEFSLLFFFLFIFYDKIIAVHPQANKIVLFFLCLLPFFTLFQKISIVTRVKDYFIISYAFICNYLMNICHKRYRLFISLFVLAWSAFGFFRFILKFDDGALMDYQSTLLSHIFLL